LLQRLHAGGKTPHLLHAAWLLQQGPSWLVMQALAGLLLLQQQQHLMCQHGLRSLLLLLGVLQVQQGWPVWRRAIPIQSLREGAATATEERAPLQSGIG
jgi:hypothetical protein